MTAAFADSSLVFGSPATRNVWSLLASEYVIRRQLDVRRALEREPGLTDLLVEIRVKLAEHFGSQVRAVLEFVDHADARGDDWQLIVSVDTGKSVDAARQCLAAFDDGYWLDAVDRARGRVVVTVAFS